MTKEEFEEIFGNVPFENIEKIRIFSPPLRYFQMYYNA